MQKDTAAAVPVAKSLQLRLRIRDAGEFVFTLAVLLFMSLARLRDK